MLGGKASEMLSPAENATPTPWGSAPDPALTAVRPGAVGKQRQPPSAKLIFYLGVKGRCACHPHPFGFDDETVKIRMRLPVAPLTLHRQSVSQPKTISNPAMLIAGRTSPYNSIATMKLSKKYRHNVQLSRDKLAGLLLNPLKNLGALGAVKT